MKMAEWIGIEFSRPWRFFKESFFGGKELVSIEEDPVGEFLDKKKSGIVIADKVENEVQQAGGEAVQATAAITAITTVLLTPRRPSTNNPSIGRSCGWTALSRPTPPILVVKS